MKLKRVAGIMAYPYLDKLVIAVDRRVINRNFSEIVRHHYKFDYNDHIELVLKRFSKMIEIHHINIVNEIKRINKAGVSND